MGTRNVLLSISAVAFAVGAGLMKILILDSTIQK